MTDPMERLAGFLEGRYTLCVAVPWDDLLAGTHPLGGALGGASLWGAPPRVLSSVTGRCAVCGTQVTCTLYGYGT